MATPRPTTRWLTRAAAAVALAAGLSLWAAFRTGGEATPRLATLGAAATALVVAGLAARSPEVLAGGIIAVVALCAGALAVTPGPIALGIGLAAFALAESAFATLDTERRRGGMVPVAAEGQRRRFLGAVVGLSLLAGVLALVVADGVATSGNLVVEALGVAAILGVAGLVVSLSRRVQPPRHMG